MRAEIYKKVKGISLTHSPFEEGTFSEKIKVPPLLLRRGGVTRAAELRCRPCIQNYVLQNRSVHVSCCCC